MSNAAAMLHLVVLSLWGGVVATEAVVELYPFRQRELHTAVIRLHYWIDLLVELPLVLAVVATGAVLALTVERLTAAHWVKIGFGTCAILVNLFCIAVVIRRRRRLGRGEGDQASWRASRTVLACFAVGLLCAGIAAALGFRFALARGSGAVEASPAWPPHLRTRPSNGSLRRLDVPWRTRCERGCRARFVRAQRPRAGP